MQQCLRANAGVWSAAALLLAVVGSGCEPYRIEYIKRPEFYKKASGNSMQERSVDDDGTIIVNVFGDEDETELQRRASSESEPFKIREEFDDGRVVLRALLPEHVLANTLTCIQKQEYELLWDQLVSQRTKLAYEEKGLSRDDFVQFFREHRQELARTMNRMVLGLPRQEVVSENLGGGVMQFRFVPQVAGAFKFRTVQMVSEDFSLRLLLIK